MRAKWTVLFLILFQSCRNEPEVANYKDLEQNMMDLKLYQENLGDQIKSKDLQDASWLLEGMDSILHILNKKFKEHRRLSHPFSYFYKRRLQSPIRDIRKSIEANDTAKALNSYKVLVKQCNNCHIDNDVDKEVRF